MEYIKIIKSYIDKITDLNFKSLNSDLGSIEREKNLTKLNNVVRSLLNSFLYMPCNRGINNNLVMNMTFSDIKYSSLINNKKSSIEKKSSIPLTLCSVPNHKFMYLRTHPEEEVDSFHVLPNRDLLVSAYPWSNCFSIKSILESSISISKLLSHIDNIVETEQQRSVSPERLKEHKYDVFFWSLRENLLVHH